VTARLDADGRCMATDLFPDQCACPDHRGGALPAELDPHGQGLASARRDKQDHGRDRWGSEAFTSRWPGVCGWCNTPFPAESLVRYDAEDVLVGPCCAEDDSPPEVWATHDA